jgi:type II secretory pathway pseudopilin PulG
VKLNIKRAIRKRAVRALAAGFSLAEATVAMALVGTAVAALCSGFATGIFTMQMARENLRATQIMLEKVETIRLYSWDQINTPGFIPPEFTAQYDPSAPPGQGGVTYYGTLTISTNAPVGASYSNNMALVTVTLHWKTGSLDRTRQFTTYISRYGLQDYIY